jgi:hypothetical protein
VVRAVDNAGAMSPPTWTGFYADNVPPTVRITNPMPSDFFVTEVGATIPIRWQGIDPDGIFTTQPVKYKFRLFTEDEPEYTLAVVHPDSFYRFYSPTYTGWDSLPGDSTSIRYTNLTIGKSYLFAITAFDEAGDDDPFFSMSKNMLRMKVAYPGTIGPRFTVFNDFFNYTYPAGGDYRDRPISVEVPSAQRMSFNWFAEPGPGIDIVAYRHVIDPTDLEDDAQWSVWSQANSSELGPFLPPGVKREIHSLYIEALDSIENKSLVRVDLIVVPATLASELLVVNDTRFEADKFLPGQTCPTITGPWPVASELDTFLFARGNVNWRCQGTIMPIPKTKPGLFSTYRPDTIGTRTRIRYLRDSYYDRYMNAGNPVPLAVLNQYRHVVWITDGLGATYLQENDLIKPGTALRYMSAPNRLNTLAAYVKQGGKVWLAGGGAGYAAGINFNDRNNDSPTVTFSSISSYRGELIPGRFMYDFAAWQSEYRVTNAAVNIFKAAGRYDSAGVGPPPYGFPPARLELKTRADDPIAQEAPTRTQSAFYQSTIFIEFLQEPNSVVEDLDPDPDVENGLSTLDTLYRATGSQLFKPVQHVPMTYYHGTTPGNVSVVFSGFPFWSFKRTQGQGLVDFVLRDLWGLSPSAPAPPVATRDP